MPFPFVRSDFLLFAHFFLYLLDFSFVWSSFSPQFYYCHPLFSCNFRFFIFVPTFPFLRTCAYIFIGNFHAIKRHIFQVQVRFGSHILIITYVLLNEHGKFFTTCALFYSVPNIFVFLIWCCARSFSHRLAYFSSHFYMEGYRYVPVWLLPFFCTPYETYLKSFPLN